MSKNIRTHEADYKLTQKFLDYANCADASYALLEYTNEKYKIDEDKNDFGDGQKLGSTYFNKDTNTEQISTYARAIEARFNQDSKNSQGKKIDNKIQNVSKEIDSTQYKDSNGCHIFNTENNIPQKLLYISYSILGILVIASFNACSFKSIDPQYYEFKRLCKNVDSEVTIYNQDYFDIIKNHKNIKTNGKGCFYSEKLKREVCFGNFDYKGRTEFERGNLSKVKWELWYSNIHYATQIEYNYKYFGLWLQGDEAAGWHWETKDTLICEDLKR